MPKTKLKTDAGTDRVNTLVQAETMRNVRLVAVETNRSISAAVDWLLRRGIKEYVREQQNPEGSR